MDNKLKVIQSKNYVIDYKLLTSNGTILQEKKMMSLVTPRDELLREVIDALENMNFGEEIQLVFKDIEFLNRIWMQYNLDKDTCILCIVKLISCHHLPLIKSILEQKKNLACCYKEKGNVYIKRKKYVKATKLYLKSLEFLSCPDECEYSNQEMESLKVIRNACLLNLAACCLNMDTRKSIEDCIRYCTQVIQVDEHNVKARYRRGLALMKTKDYQKSIQDFLIASHFLPKNNEIAHALEQVQKKYNSRREKEYKTYQQLEY